MRIEIAYREFYSKLISRNTVLLEIVYLSWDQGRYDKDMKYNHQNSIPRANFSSRLSRNKSHQLFRERHCFTPDMFLSRCTFW